MVNGISYAIAGIFAFTKKIGYSSQNVANVNSEAYKRDVTTIKEDKLGLPEVNSRKDTAPGMRVPETDGTIRELSNVDLAIEMADMIVAQRAYEANLKTLKTQDEQVKAVLDILA